MRRASPYLPLSYALLAGWACGRSSGQGAAVVPSAEAFSLDAAVLDAPAPSSAPVEAAAPVATPRDPPAVKVENIGMHIGGGPNDAISKAPIADSVAPHMSELRACWTQVADATRGGDFGVDLLIPAAGGRAEVSHPRTALGPDAFRDCVVAVFTAVDFQRPRTGRTTVSYSLRFTPVQ